MDHLEYEYDGLQISSCKVSYDRVYVHLSPFLSPQVWQRHQYSLKDIETTLSYFRTTALSPLALVLGFEMTNSYVNPGCASMTNVEHAPKSTTIQHIMKEATKYIQANRPSVLDTRHANLKPPFPRHRLDRNPSRVGDVVYWMGFPWYAEHYIPDTRQYVMKRMIPRDIAKQCVLFPGGSNMLQRSIEVKHQNNHYIVGRESFLTA